MNIKLIDIKHMYASDSKVAEGLMRDYTHEIMLDGLLHHAFYDGFVHNFDTLMSFSLDKSNIFMLVWDNDIKKVVAHIFLNGFEALVCRAHFSVLRIAHGREYSVRLGKEVIWKIFELKRDNSNIPLTRTLVGLTPVQNKNACRFAKLIGFKEVAILPKSCYISLTGSFESGMLSVLTK